MKILIIEDEPDRLDARVKSLVKENQRTETAEDYETAIEKVLLYSYDCNILDITLPEGSGLEQSAEKKDLTPALISRSTKKEVKLNRLLNGCKNIVISNKI